MKKTVAITLLSIILIFLASCTMLQESISIFQADPVIADVRVNGVKVNSEEPIQVSEGDRISVNFASPEFIRFLRDAGLSDKSAMLILSFDSRYVELVNATYYPNYDIQGLLEARDTTLEDYEEMYAVVDEWIDFQVVAVPEEADTCISGEYIRKGYAGKYTNTKEITLL